MKASLSKETRKARIKLLFAGAAGVLALIAIWCGAGRLLGTGPFAHGSGESTEETVQAAALSSPPSFLLRDMLAGSYDPDVPEKEILFGNYEWTYPLEGQMVTAMACGAGPLDFDPDTLSEDAILWITEYRDAEGNPFAEYYVESSVEPDTLTVTEWDLSMAGIPQEGGEQTAEGKVTVYETPIIQLRPEKVYEISAQWKDEKLEERQFCGTASYVVVTKAKKE